MYDLVWASQVALMVKNPPANAGNIRGWGLIPGPGRCPGGGTGNQLQYSCLGDPMDSGAWWAIVHRVAKSRTWLKQLSMHAWYGLKLFFVFCFISFFFSADWDTLNWLFHDWLMLLCHTCGLKSSDQEINNQLIIIKWDTIRRIHSWWT